MSKNIGVLGVGYVGFSISKTFSKKYKVIGYDISNERVNLLNENKSEDLENVTFTTNENLLKDCNVFVIAVPTNIDKSKNIDLKHLYSAKETIKKYLKPYDMIIIESSIHVGGTEEIFGDLLNANISIGHSPERISPGDYEDGTKIPKIISGMNNYSLKNIKHLYESVFDTIVQVSSCKVSEMCKLYENCFRVVNIAYINEIADLCKYKGIDVNEVISAASTKPFGFMRFYPGYGIGGYCLNNNPHFLMHTVDNAEKTLPILSKSITVLNNRPYCSAYKIKYDNIFFIGIGFKKNQMLTAYSPALTLYNELLHRNKKVYLYDPLNNINSDFDFTLDNLLNYECIILGNQMDCIDYKILEQYKKHKEVIEY